MNPQPSIARPKESPDYFSNCTHCGFCLAVCPTYKLTGDENNSPRGRLRLWSEEAAGRLPRDPWTDHYTSECVGCLACEPACPATVPYGEIFERVRHEHVRAGLSCEDRSFAWQRGRPHSSSSTFAGLMSRCTTLSTR